MTDLQIAENNLTGHTICLCKDGNCLFSEKRGISPMMDFIADGVDLNGYSAVDLVVGKAAAMLFVKCGVKNVFAKTISASAVKVFEKYGVEYGYGTLTEKIINRSGTGPCPMEQAVMNAESPDEAYAILKNKLNELKPNG